MRRISASRCRTGAELGFFYQKSTDEFAMYVSASNQSQGGPAHGRIAAPLFLLDFGTVANPGFATKNDDQ